MKKILILTAVLSVLLPLSSLSAQTPPPPVPPEEQMINKGEAIPPDAPPPPPRERYHTMQMWKLTEVLDLTEDQAAKFFPKFNNFQKKVDEIRDANEKLFEKLDGYIRVEDKKNIVKTIEEIEKNETSIMEEHKKFRKELTGVLDEIQMGKLVHFQHEFPRRFRDAMWDIRGKGPRPDKDQRPGRGPGGGGEGRNPGAPQVSPGWGGGSGLHLNQDCPLKQ